MRIVIDMQGAQTQSRFGSIGRYTLNFVHSVIKNRGNHEIVLALNGAFPHTIELIRSEFNGLLPQESIRIWQQPNGLVHSAGENPSRAVGESIREAFLATLNADVIHVSSFFEGYADDAVTSIGRFDVSAAVSVALFDGPVSAQNQTRSAGQFLHNQEGFLKNASCLFAIASEPEPEWQEWLGAIGAGTITSLPPIAGKYFFALPPSVGVMKLHERLNLARPFIVCDGDIRENGGARKLIQAYAAMPSVLCDQHQIAITGPLTQDAKTILINQMLSLGLSPDILRFTGELDERDLGQLYRSCRLRVMPVPVTGGQLAVLESILCGAPTIGVSGSGIERFHGLKDALIPNDGVRAIAEKMTSALQDERFRLALREQGLLQIGTTSWDECAAKAIAAWESMARPQTKRANEGMTSAVLQSIVAHLPSMPAEGVLCQIAASVAFALQVIPTKRRLFVDVSEIRRRDLKTGIQRVVRSWLLELLATPELGYQVEPVYLTDEGGRWTCRYARDYLRSLIGDVAGNDDIIDPVPGDVWLGMDLTGGLMVQAERAGLFANYRNLGVQVIATVYDLLPVRMPEVFPRGGEDAFREWLFAISRLDGAICISKAVADDLRQWRLDAGFDDARRRPYRISWTHLGADVASSAPSNGLPDDADAVLAALRDRPSFLMVGTLEPRKGHIQVLDAFEHLWNAGEEVNLVIVGKQGWLVDELVVRLHVHAQAGRRLFWLQGASDEYLAKIYSSSSCLVAASYGEGFGLPLIEAAHHKMPILARDIPVFREVAGQHAFYFNAEQGDGLAVAIQQWLKLHSTGQAPVSEEMSFLTWKQSAANLVKNLT